MLYVYIVYVQYKIYYTKRQIPLLYNSKSDYEYVYRRFTYQDAYIWNMTVDDIEFIQNFNCI